MRRFAGLPARWVTGILVALAAAFGPATAHGQGAVFVSNETVGADVELKLGSERTSGSTRDGPVRRYQGFRTGSNPDGYLLNAVVLYLNDFTSADHNPGVKPELRVRLRSVDRIDPPIPMYDPMNDGEQIFQFVTPTTFGQVAQTFVPPSSATDEQRTLAPNSWYALDVSQPQKRGAENAEHINALGTRSDGHDIAVEGWKISHFHRNKTFPGTNWHIGRIGKSSFRMKVRATRIKSTPVVTLIADPGSIGENGGQATITASVRPAASTAFTVDVTAAPDPDTTATASDVTLSANTTLTFAAGATTSTGTVTLSAVNDGTYTGDRRVILSGTSTASIEGLEIASISATIVEDEAEVLAPVDFAATPTHDSALLSWRNPPRPSRSYVEYRWSTDGGSTFGSWIRIPRSERGRPHASRYEVRNLSSSTAYVFRLRYRRSSSDDQPTPEAEASATTFEPFTARFTSLQSFEDTDRPELIVDQLFVVRGEFSAPLRTNRALAPAHGLYDYDGADYRSRSDARQPREFWLKFKAKPGTRTVTVTLEAPDGPGVRCAEDEADGTPILKICSDDLRPLAEDVTAIVRARRKLSLSLDNPSISENGGVATLSARLHPVDDSHRPVGGPVSDVDVWVDVEISDGAGDIEASATRLTIPAGRTQSNPITLTARDNDEPDGQRTVTITPGTPSHTHIELDESAGFELTVHDDGDVLEPGKASNPLTAEFRDVPDAHRGAAFTLELRFSEELPLSYLTLQDHALSVAGGTLAGVARAPQGQNRVWDVTVVPAAGAGDVMVTLAATTDCTATDAICTEDDRALSAQVLATVPRTVPAGTPFQVRLEDVPDEHDGASAITFKVLFNKEPAADYSYVTMRDSTLVVRQGGETLTVTGVERAQRPRNDRWNITVTPGSKADLAVSVGPFASCEETGAVCAEEGGEVLSNAVSKTILGPPGLIVADARVDEAPSATLDFAVTLARESTATVTVAYVTSDGTARAGEDYTATSGTLTFRPGETRKTVSVPVLADAHDEGEETLTLTLSAPQGGSAWLEVATATGTIVNSGPMPRAWLARFGRTVAEQVLEAVEGRFAASRNAGVEVRLAGQAFAGASAEDIEALEEREAQKRLAALSQWLQGGTDDADAGAGDSRALTGRNLLTGTAFTLTGGTSENGFGAAWGRGALSGFDGREGELTLDGEVASAMLGADLTRERSTVGMMLTHSRGKGGYRSPTAQGEVESTLTALYPYGRYEVSERVALWGVAGYGAGELVLAPEGQVSLSTDMDLVMGAVGVRGVAVEAGTQGGLELSVKTDAMAVRTSTDAVRASSGGNLASAEAVVTRLRLGLEGTWRGLGAESGVRLVPTLEVGVRHDGGDAETGFGLDVGAGLAWSDPGSGLSAELRARGLLTHEADGFRDRGVSGSLAWDPRPDSARGVALTLSQTMGAQAAGGMDTLLGHRHLGGLAADEGGALESRQLEVKLGYGFGMFGDQFTATPEAALGLSDRHRALSLGWRLGLARTEQVSMELGLTGTRREATGDDAEAVHALMLQGEMRW